MEKHVKERFERIEATLDRIAANEEEEDRKRMRMIEQGIQTLNQCIIELAKLQVNA